MADKQEQQVQTAIRVPTSWLERIDKLAVKMSQPGMPVTRAQVLRLSILRGLDELEGEWGKKR